MSEPDQSRRPANVASPTCAASAAQSVAGADPVVEGFFAGLEIITGVSADELKKLAVIRQPVKS